MPGEHPSSDSGSGNDAQPWPVVSPSEVWIAQFDWDLAYMGVYLRLQVCNFSAYLVRETEIRVDALAQATQRVLTSRVLRVGPLLPGVRVHEEVGIGAREPIGGLRFDTVVVRAVSLTPPREMVPAGEYPALRAEVVGVDFDPEAPDLRRRAGDWPGDLPTTARHAIRIRVRNAGSATVERARLKVRYFDAGVEAASGQAGAQREPVAEWVLDMPREGWSPYLLPAAPDAACEPADPLAPGQAHDFTLTHYGGGPHGWTGSIDAVSVAVSEVRLRPRI
jgi:hypothetical protein